jgi:hypothetical protein
MIQPLRKAHQRIWFVLAFLLPTLFLTGMTARARRRPRVATVPPSQGSQRVAKSHEQPPTLIEPGRQP